MRHGLTAETLVGQLVGEDVFQAFVDAITEEFGAQTAVELGLVRRAAHDLAAMDLARLAELAVFMGIPQLAWEWRPVGRRD